MDKRKLLAALLAVVMLVSLLVAGMTVGSYGGTLDLDGDKRVTMHDAQLAKEYEEGKRKLNDTQRFAKADYRSYEFLDKILGKAEEDDRLDVLMIGNSFSCGYGEELAGMLEAAGIKARIFSVYFPSCTTKKHWEWTENDETHYRLRHYLQTGGYITQGYEEVVNGAAVIKDPVDLDYCLAAVDEWDVITLQNHFNASTVSSYDNALSLTAPYAEKMYDYLKQKYPDTRFLWYETWIFDADQSTIGGVENQKRMQNIVRQVSTKVATDNGISMIPCGGAWDIARTDYDLGVMTRGDKVHDGTTGGGQYLNACVWFETLTGQSCIGNTYRPGDYTLDEDRAQTLQQIAHRAVQENPVP